MKIVTYNMLHNKRSTRNWSLILDKCDPDIVLAQESLAPAAYQRPLLRRGQLARSRRMVSGQQHLGQCRVREGGNPEAFGLDRVPWLGRRRRGHEGLIGYPRKAPRCESSASTHQRVSVGTHPW